MEEDDDDSGGGGGGIPTEVISSYLNFARRAVASRRLLSAVVFVFVAALIIGVTLIWPKTYHTEMRMTAQRNNVLSTQRDSADALQGASDTILRRENLEEIAKRADLVRVFHERRPPALRLKDNIMEKLRGPLDPRDEMTGQVLTLESKLKVEVKDGALSIACDWSDPETAAALTKAAADSFLEARHSAEISTYIEMISILESHASSLRAEIESVAEQMRTLRKEKRDAAKAKLKEAQGDDEAAPKAAPRRFVPRARISEDDGSVTDLKAQLESKQQELKALEDARLRRLQELEGKLTELQSTYTAQHPAVLDVRQKISVLQNKSPQAAQLEQDIGDLQAAIRKKSAAGSPLGGMGGLGGGGTDSTAAAPLSADLMSLMQDTASDLDPAVAAQLDYAVREYSNLRNQIISARIELDTAQAGFNRRYKVVTPAEVPTKPIKPKVPMLIGAGIFIALLLALIVPVIAELRSGQIVEQWQVQQLMLPVLAELRFPPGQGD